MACQELSDKTGGVMGHKGYHQTSCYMNRPIAIISACVGFLVLLIAPNSAFCQSPVLIKGGLMVKQEVFIDLRRAAYIHEGDIVITKNVKNGEFVGDYVWGFHDDKELDYKPSTLQKLAKMADGIGEGHLKDYRVSQWEVNQLLAILKELHLTRDKKYEEMKEEDTFD